MAFEAGRTGVRADTVTMDPARGGVVPSAQWVESRAPTAMFLAGCAAALVLILWPDYLPMVDAPNHMARLSIIAAPDGSPLRRLYDVSWPLVPDLGLDLVFVALKGFVAPAFVLRLCVLAAMVATLTSAYLIQKAIFGRLSWSIAFVPIFVFGLAWYIGLINFQMGVGAALVGLALFIRADRRLDLKGGVLLSAIGLIACICHVAAFAAFMLVLSALHCAEELGAPRRAAFCVVLRKGVNLTFVFLPGLLLYALSEKPDHTWGVKFGLKWKLFLPLDAVIATGTYVDALILAWAVAIFALLGVCGGLRVWRPGRPALILLTVCIVLLPAQINNAMLIDSRLMLVLAIIALSITEIGFPLRGIRPAVAIVAVAALILYRASTILAVETRNDRDVAQFRAAMQAVNGHTKILVAADTLTRADCTRSAADLGQASLHAQLGSFLTIDRAAFIQLIFAGRGEQPIRARGDYAPISSPASQPVPVTILQLADDPAQAAKVDAQLAENVVDRFVLDWRRDFDDMLVLHFGCARNPFPGELTPVIDGAFFTLYRIDRPHAP